MIYSLQEGKGPLHEAVASGHTDIVNILITHGANLDLKNRVKYFNRYMCLYTCLSKLY